MGPKLSAILFDLDGTLIDSIPLILASFRHALDTHGLGHVTDQAIRDGLGTPLHAHLHSLAPHLDTDELVATYRRFNHAEHDRWVSAFEGIHTALDQFTAAGLPLGIVTSKRTVLARHGVQVCGLTHDFRTFIGPEEVRQPKPHPEPLLLAASQLGIAPKRIAYVGDSHHDLAAANAAGMFAIGAGWGTLDRDRLAAEKPYRLFDSPSELTTLLA